VRLLEPISDEVVAGLIGDVDMVRSIVATARMRRVNGSTTTA
jgi:hypothetical protein